MRLARWLTALFGVLCVLSIVPVFTGDDPLSAIFVVVLGSPWIQLVSTALANLCPGHSCSVVAGIALGVFGMGINTAIVYFVSRWLALRRRPH